MKDNYRDTLDRLAFSEEQKRAMKAGLLAAAQAGQSRTPRRKWGRVIAAAAAAAALCAACATGVLQEAVDTLCARFGSEPEQVELIQEFTQPVLASDTDNGVTVTIEAVLGDSERSFLLCRMERTDGQPVLPEETTSSANPYRYQSYSFETASFQGTLGSSDAAPIGFSAQLGAGTEFLTASSDGGSLYFFFDFLWNDGRFPVGEITLQLKDLSDTTYSFPNGPQGEAAEPEIQTTLLVEGEWEFSFSFPEETQSASIELADGQTFHPGTDPAHTTVGTLQSLRLSPFFLTMEYTYTADEAAVAEATASYAPASQLSLEEWVCLALTNTFMDTPSYLTLTDGTKHTLQQLGGLSGDGTKPGQFTLFVSFQKILPLDTVESLTIGDLTIPVS